MNNKKGLATLYIIVTSAIFLSIMTYIFSITSNLEMDLLTDFNEIKNEYENEIKNKDSIFEKLETDLNQN